jgi:hypothetical protein
MELRKESGLSFSPSIALVVRPSKVRISSWAERSSFESSNRATPASSPCARRALDKVVDKTAASQAKVGHFGYCQIQRWERTLARVINTSFGEAIIARNASGGQ